MVFSSVTFLVYFLPFVFVLLYCLPKTYHNGFLLTVSLIFYGWTSPQMLILLLFEITVGYYAGKAIARYRDHAKWILIAAVTLYVGLFCFFKYTNFLIANVNEWFRTTIPLLDIVLPLGISFYTFQIISYNVDVYRYQVQPQDSYLRFALYVSMFPQLIAGPVVRYEQVEKSLISRKITAESAASGLNRFICGLCKKVLLANQLYELIGAYRACPEPSVIFAWYNALATMLFVYFDFSGYSDMAIGLGKMLGFKFPENFNYPLIAPSVTTFWRRWNMSLTGWFRDYIYIPMGGSRCRPARHLFNMFVVWSLTGIWHGSSWNYLFWGFGFFVVLVLEKYIFNKMKISEWIRFPFIWIILMISFQLFYSSGLRQFAADFRIMFGMNGLPFNSPFTVYEILNSLVLILICLFAIFPWGKELHQRFMKTKAAMWIQPVLSALMFVICLSYLIGGSLNPFVYFQF